ncbi:MAG: hypothetical protein P8O75_05340 [Gammaproteobacteria bacterium]|nr:hypothetical protein [Gammaproteobacteria bacterium]
MSYQLQHSNYFRLMLLAYIALFLLCIFHFDIANGLKLSLLAVLTAVLVYELRQQQKPLNKLMLGQQSFAIGDLEGRWIQLDSISVRPLAAGIVLLRGRYQSNNSRFWQTSTWGLLLASDSLSQHERLSFIRHCITLQEQDLVAMELPGGAHA